MSNSSLQNLGPTDTAIAMSGIGTFRPTVQCARMSVVGVGTDMTQRSSKRRD